MVVGPKIEYRRRASYSRARVTRRGSGCPRGEQLAWSARAESTTHRSNAEEIGGSGSNGGSSASQTTNTITREHGTLFANAERPLTQ
ncbi:hypothetical protein HPB50_021622 [Hyalomma asiaticum]|uniref:Uncharacterized protein n=1 Tax=Hyalomma asiaticum TaxID=266040 RepID=A0ACB7SYT2_HYAAI|nr:hypothetical protein HPB50_021622 [Hyalomma asiaticum]